MLLALDTETTGPDPNTCGPFALSLCDENGSLWFWQWPVDPFTREPNYDDPSYLECVKAVSKLVKKDTTLIYHNAIFDRRMLQKCPGLEHIADHPKMEDTLLLSHAVDSAEAHGLKELCEKHLGISSDDEKELHSLVNHCRTTAREHGWSIGPNYTWDFWLPNAIDPKSKVLKTYGVRDAERTMMLYKFYQLILKDHLKPEEAKSISNGYTMNKKIVPVIMAMENRGITVNRNTLRKEIKRYQNTRDEHYDTIHRMPAVKKFKAITQTDFNLNSDQQLASFLFDGLGLEPQRLTKGGKPSVSADNLKALMFKSQSMVASRFIGNLLAARMNDTAQTYLSGYEAVAFQHDTHKNFLRLPYRLNPVGTRTTRFSSGNPVNIQNISKGKEFDSDDLMYAWVNRQNYEKLKITDFNLRTVFQPLPDEVWYAFDYDQLQLRIFAAAAKEQSIIDAFRQGIDYHTYVAQRIFNVETPSKIQRRIAKNVNFALIFGASAKRVDATAGLPGAYNMFRKQFPAIDRYMSQTIRFAKKNGFVETLGGYRLTVPPEKPYIGVNYIVQGTEGEIVKNAMIECDREIPEPMVLQVHDEILFRFDKAPSTKHKKRLSQIKYLMEKTGGDLGVELVASCDLITKDYANGKKVKL